MNATERSTLTLRLPAQVKDWLGNEARANGGSKNAEIIRAVRERMERVNAKTAGESAKTAPTA